MCEIATLQASHLCRRRRNRYGHAAAALSSGLYVCVSLSAGCIRPTNTPFNRYTPFILRSITGLRAAGCKQPARVYDIFFYPQVLAALCLISMAKQ
jgi:hypothetical protein